MSQLGLGNQTSEYLSICRRTSSVPAIRPNSAELAKRPCWGQRLSGFAADYQSFGTEGPLDIVANIVGILIILVLVAGMRVKHALEESVGLGGDADIGLNDERLSSRLFHLVQIFGIPGETGPADMKFN